MNVNRMGAYGSRTVLFIAAIGTATALLGGAGCSGSAPKTTGSGSLPPTAGSIAPTTTTTPPPASTMSTPVEEINWPDSTVDIPANTTGCAAGTANFRGGKAVVAETTYEMFARWQRAALYADFDHDGRTDAAVAIVCLNNPAAANPPALLLVISGTADRRPMGVLVSTQPRDYDPNGNAGQTVQDLQLTGGPAVRFTLRNYEGTGRCTAEYFWRDGKFTYRSMGDADIPCRR